MTVTPFKDLPLAGREHDWDAAEADKRVRRWAGAEEQPNTRYRDAHLWYDAGDAEHFGAYKLPIADVLDGELKVVPRAVFSAAAIMDGARGGIDIPEGDVAGVKDHLARYYAKLGEAAPWER